MSLFDDVVQRGTRYLAGRTSRRSMLGRVGRTLGGAAVAIPVLPVDRVAKFAHAAETAAATDNQACEYWRYCAFDGFLCTCCGGGVSGCPAGTTNSSVSWVGTCRNPIDNTDYLISYNDCCGKSSCGRCACNTNLNERPAYLMGVHNDINWCMAEPGSQIYHCTVAVVVGVGESHKG
ncbi:MAG: methylamine dehydrogenase light chain [Geminicoccaceae bacterium]